MGGEKLGRAPCWLSTYISQIVLGNVGVLRSIDAMYNLDRKHFGGGGDISTLRAQGQFDGGPRQLQVVEVAFCKLKVDWTLSCNLNLYRYGQVLTLRTLIRLQP